MRIRLGLILSFYLVVVFSSHAQQVVRINRPYLLIDESTRTNVKIGEVYRLYRWEGQSAVLTGRIKALVFKDQYCAFKITEESNNTKIKLGDWVLQPNAPMPESVTGPVRQKNTPGSRSGNAPQIIPVKNKHLMSWLTITAGLVAGGFAYHNWDLAESASEITPVSPEHYAELVDDVRQYDKNTNFLSGVGSGLIVFGIAHYFITRDKGHIQLGDVSLTSQSRPGWSSVGISLALK